MKEITAGLQEAQAIKDPSTGELVVSNSEIKKGTLEYCHKTLKNNEPEDEVRESIELKEELHKLRINDDTDDTEYNTTDEDYFKTLRKFEAKNSKVYDFITKAGVQFQMVILNFAEDSSGSKCFPQGLT